MPYTELRAHSNFSFLEGASHVEELVLRALRRQDYALAKSAALTTGMLAMTS